MVSQTGTGGDGSGVGGHVAYLTVVALVAEGGGDAVLDGFDPGLSQLLRVGLHHAAPVGTDVGGVGGHADAAVA